MTESSRRRRAPALRMGLLLVAVLMAVAGGQRWEFLLRLLPVRFHVARGVAALLGSASSVIQFRPCHYNRDLSLYYKLTTKKRRC